MSGVKTTLAAPVTTRGHGRTPDSHSLSVSLLFGSLLFSYFQSISRSLSLYLLISFLPSLELYVSVSLDLSLFFCLHLSVYLSLSRSRSLSLARSLSLCHCPTLFLCFSVSFSLSVSVQFSLSLSLSTALSLPITVLMGLIKLPVLRSLSLFPCQSVVDHN